MLRSSYEYLRMSGKGCRGLARWCAFGVGRGVGVASGRLVGQRVSRSGVLPLAFDSMPVRHFPLPTPPPDPYHIPGDVHHECNYARNTPPDAPFD